MTTEADRQIRTVEAAGSTVPASLQSSNQLQEQSKIRKGVYHAKDTGAGNAQSLLAGLGRNPNLILKYVPGQSAKGSDWPGMSGIIAFHHPPP